MNPTVVFHYLRYTCLHYEPTKPNKKKIKHLVEAMPYFLPDPYQNLFFELIHRYPLNCYWDSQACMKEYVFLIYSSFHEALKKTHKKKDDFYSEVYVTETMNKKRIHTFLYFIVVCVILYLLYRLR